MSVRSARQLWFCLLLLPPLLALQCGPSRDAQLAEAEIKLQSGDFAAARRIYNRILERYPYDAEALQGAIDASRKDENPNPGQLAEFYRRLLQLRPWDREANLAVGRRQMEQGKLKEAAVRFYMAYLESDFLQEKKDALALLQEIKVREQQLAASPTEISSGTENAHD